VHLRFFTIYCNVEQSRTSTKAYLDGHFYRADRHRTPWSAYTISTASLTRSCYDRLTGLHARFRARVSINAEPRTSAKSVSRCRFLDMSLIMQPHHEKTGWYLDRAKITANCEMRVTWTRASSRDHQVIGDNWSLYWKKGGKKKEKKHFCIAKTIIEEHRDRCGVIRTQTCTEEDSAAFSRLRANRQREGA